jgi:hypothetical protein
MASLKRYPDTKPEFFSSLLGAGFRPRLQAMTIRRLKTYTGSQGYVYQYYFVGKRPAATSVDHELNANEFIFDVTSDRKLTYAVSIFLPHQVVAAWAESHGRPLSDSEQYAAVKLRLFRAFDELEDMQAHGRRLLIDLQSLEEALTSLGVE